MFNQPEKDKAEHILKGLENRITLKLLKKGKHGFSAELYQFAHQLARLSDFIAVEESFATNSHLAPAINMASSYKQNIYYAALPRGAELGPFLRTIVNLGNGCIPLKADTLHHLQALNQEITMEVLITKSCPVCPRMVELVNQFALCSHKVKAWIVDVDYFPHIRQKHHAVSAPTTVINNRAQIIGAVNEKELLNWIDKAISQEDILDLLASLLATGNSQRTLEIITEENRLDLLVDLMGQEEFTVRLGTMVVIEALQQKSPDKVRLLVPGLIKLLDSDNINVRGDTAFMLGKTGDQRAIEPLSRLLSEQNRDLVEITKEALDLLQR